VTLRRDLELVIVEDLLGGRGHAGVDVRWHFALPVVRGVPEAARARLVALERTLGAFQWDGAVTIGDDARCVLIRAAPYAAEVHVEEGLFSPGYGQIETVPLVSVRSRLNFPKILKTFLIRLGA
jgi:hypothetical protein